MRREVEVVGRGVESCGLEEEEYIILVVIQKSWESFLSQNKHRTVNNFNHFSTVVGCGEFLDYIAFSSGLFFFKRRM